MDQILKKYSSLRHLNVSRETCLDFDRFTTMIIKKNKEINLISMNTAKEDIIRDRHIIDSAQTYDIVDLNDNTTSDLGSGSGLPGLIIAIMIKNFKKNHKVKLYEKSHHKSTFLREVSRELNLNTEVIQKDVFKLNKLESGTIMARAFKPLPVVLELVYKNFDRYKNLIIFMGTSGNEILKETLKNWELEFEKVKSITNADSFILNIKNIKKKAQN